MKSVVSLLLCFVMIFTMSACSAVKEKFVLEESCNTVTFLLDEMNIEGELNYKSRDDITFTLTQPEFLRDISFSKNEISTDDMKIGFLGPKEESPVHMLLSIVSDISEREILLPSKGEYVFKGNIPQTDYRIIFDCQKGKIASIEAGKFSYIFE